MLRDLNDSDPSRLKYIVKKIKDMADGTPNLVLGTIHDYFVDNPQVGMTPASQGSQGEQRGGLKGGFSIQRYVIWGKSNSFYIQ